MQSVAGHQHDLIAGHEVLTEERLSARDQADGAAGELDVVCGEQPRQRRRLTAPPDGPGIDARLAPAGEQTGTALAMLIPG